MIYLIVYLTGFLLFLFGGSRVNHDGIQGIRLGGWVVIILWPVYTLAFLLAAFCRITGT